MTMTTRSVFVYALFKCIRSCWSRFAITKAAALLLERHYTWPAVIVFTKPKIVVFGNSTSYEQSIKYGVPQGSILWRLMFILFLMISHAKLTVATWFFAPIILDMLVKMEIQPVWSDICSQHWINFLFGLTTIVYGWIPRKLFIFNLADQLLLVLLNSVSNNRIMRLVL